VLRSQCGLPITRGVKLGRRHVGVAFVLVFVVAAVSWLGLREWGGDPEARDPLLRAHRVLAEGSPSALVQVGVGQLLALTAEASGASAGSDTPIAVSLGDVAGLLLDPLGAVSDVVQVSPLAAGTADAMFAVHPEGGAPKVQAVLFGRFEPDAVEAALRDAVEGELRKRERGIERLLDFIEIDPETCDQAAWAIALSPQRVVIASQQSLDDLLTRLGPPMHMPPRARWQLAQVAPPLLSVEWRSQKTGTQWLHPLGRLLEAGNRSSLRSASLRIAGPGVLGGLEVSVEATPSNPADAEPLVAELSASRADVVERWKPRMPVLAGWYEALEVSLSDGVIAWRGQREVEWLRSLGDLALDALVVAASAPRAPAAGSLAEVERVDRVEPWPARFLKEQSLERLPAYGEARGQALAVDRAAGPFGIRIEGVRREAESKRLEVELHAIGPSISNLTDPDTSPRLVIDRVEDRGGRELRTNPRCGPKRRTATVPLVTELLDARIRGRALLELERSAKLSQIAKIAGHVALDLPVRTVRIVSSELEAGEVLESSGASLELAWIGERSFTYRVPPQQARLIAVRGLNSERQPLAALEAWQWADARLGTELGVRHYHDALAYVEAIFALETHAARYKFALDSALPGSLGSADYVESSQFIPYSEEQFETEFGTIDGADLEVDGAPLATASAGPFRLVLRTLSRELTDALADEERERESQARTRSTKPLAPRLEVLTPKIPNLSYYATGMELDLRVQPTAEASERAGALQPVRWESFVPARHRFGRPHLVAEIDLSPVAGWSPESVAALVGELTLRLPEQVEVLAIEDVEPGASVASDELRFTLSWLARDQFSLHMRGDVSSFFSARAFDDDGRELACQPLQMERSRKPEHDLDFRVQGRPARIEIQVAREAVRKRYPLKIDLADPGDS